MIIDNIPIKLPKNKSAFQWLNLNHFRNNGYHLNNKMKRDFDCIFRGLCGEIDGVCPDPPVELIYTIYRRDKRRVDLGNIAAIVDKFTSDSLVHCGLLPDDSTDYIKSIKFVDGGVDKQRPRATLEIRHYE
jgi:hypothetical protein